MKRTKRKKHKIRFFELVSVESGYSYSTIEKTMRAIYKTLIRELEMNGKCQIFNFGTFLIREKKSKTRKFGNPQSKNPEIGRYVHIDDSYGVSFKESERLLRMVNDDFKFCRNVWAVWNEDKKKPPKKRKEKNELDFLVDVLNKTEQKYGDKLSSVRMEETTENGESND